MFPMTVPVMIISGFLGSGKTTLLLRLLEEAHTRRLRTAVLMNELGKQDIDGLALDKFGISLEKLLDGCACCSKKSELAGSLHLLLARKPDLILIELTGVANPEEIAEVLGEPDLHAQTRLNRIITLLDAENVLDYNSVFATDKLLVDTLRRQMTAADLLIVNKTDLVSAKQLAKVEKAVRKFNEQATLLHAVNSAIDLDVLFHGISVQERPAEALPPLRAHSFRMAQAPTSQQDAAPPSHAEHSTDSGSSGATASFSRVRTLTLAPPKGVRREEIERFFQRWKNDLLRAKGYLELNGQPYLLQFAGKRVYWETAASTKSFYTVFIGLDLDERRLTSEWEALSTP
jgi:G3E family GTPase